MAAPLSSDEVASPLEEMRTPAPELATPPAPAVPVPTAGLAEEASWARAPGADDARESSSESSSDSLSESVSESVSVEETPWSEPPRHEAAPRTATPLPGAIPTDAMAGEGTASAGALEAPPPPAHVSEDAIARHVDGPGDDGEGHAHRRARGRRWRRRGRGAGYTPRRSLRRQRPHRRDPARVDASRAAPATGRGAAAHPGGLSASQDGGAPRAGGPRGSGRGEHRAGHLDGRCEPARGARSAAASPASARSPGSRRSSTRTTFERCRS